MLQVTGKRRWARMLGKCLVSKASSKTVHLTVLSLQFCVPRVRVLTRTRRGNCIFINLGINCLNKCEARRNRLSLLVCFLGTKISVQVTDVP